MLTKKYFCDIIRIEVIDLIIFNDILKMLSDKGYTAYRIRKEKLISEGTVSRLRAKQSISTNTIDVLCRLLDCQPNDLMKYEPDEEQS